MVGVGDVLGDLHPAELDHGVVKGLVLGLIQDDDADAIAGFGLLEAVLDLRDLILEVAVIGDLAISVVLGVLRDHLFEPGFLLLAHILGEVFSGLWVYDPLTVRVEPPTTLLQLDLVEVLGVLL